MGNNVYEGTINGDGDLIGEFKKIYENIEFIGFKFSKDIWENEKPNITQKLIKSLEEKSLTGQFSNLKKLWTQLVSDAIVFLKHEDEREEKEHDAFAFGVDTLSRFFDTFGSFEQYMSPVLTKTRDHIAHVMRVYMLGAIALKKMDIGLVGCGDVKKKADDTEKGLQIYDSEKEAMWCIMALCHDLGLVMENVFNVNREARKMFDQLGRISMKELEFGLSPMFQHMCLNTLRLISSDLHLVKNGITQTSAISGDAESTDKKKNIVETKYIVHTQYKYYLKFLNALDSYDHGVLSCIILIKNLVYFLESDFLLDTVKPFSTRDAQQFLVRKTILKSIASHNCDSIYHLSLMTFPFLLVLFDEMQEWDRPRPYMSFQDGRLNAKLTVNYLGDKKADFIITFSEGDVKTCHREVYEFAKHKFTRFAKLLRSAVTDPTKQFEFHFEIRDETDEKEWSYALTHISPKPDSLSSSGIDIKFPEENEKWRKMVRIEYPDDFKEYEIAEDPKKEIDWFNWLIRSY